LNASMIYFILAGNPWKPSLVMDLKSYCVLKEPHQHDMHMNISNMVFFFHPTSAITRHT